MRTQPPRLFLPPDARRHNAVLRVSFGTVPHFVPRLSKESSQTVAKGREGESPVLTRKISTLANRRTPYQDGLVTTDKGEVGGSSPPRPTTQKFLVFRSQFSVSHSTMAIKCVIDQKAQTFSSPFAFLIPKF